MENRFIDIEYDEDSGTPEAYKGVFVRSLEADVKTFASGDVVKDFADTTEWCRQNPISGRYMYSSSVDHFVMDVPGYSWDVDDLGREVIVKEASQTVQIEP